MRDALAFFFLGARGPIGRWAGRRVESWFRANPRPGGLVSP